jgi:hypothetical protein
VVARVRAALGRGSAATLDPDDPSLVVVVASDDDAEACSAALARSPAFVADAPVLLRHHLRLPPGTAAGAAATAAQDGYAPAPPDAPDLPGGGDGADSAGTAGGDALTLQRVQLLDALHGSQERSRMAGLAQRLGGDVLGWDALQPAAPTGDGSR